MSATVMAERRQGPHAHPSDFCSPQAEIPAIGWAVICVHHVPLCACHAVGGAVLDSVTSNFAMRKSSKVELTHRMVVAIILRTYRSGAAGIMVVRFAVKCRVGYPLPLSDIGLK